MKRKGILLSLIMFMFTFCMVFTTGCDNSNNNNTTPPSTPAETTTENPITTYTAEQISAYFANGFFTDTEHWTGVYHKETSTFTSITGDEKIIERSILHNEARNKWVYTEIVTNNDETETTKQYHVGDKTYEMNTVSGSTTYKVTDNTSLTEDVNFSAYYITMFDTTRELTLTSQVVDSTKVYTLSGYISEESADGFSIEQSATVTMKITCDLDDNIAKYNVEVVGQWLTIEFDTENYTGAVLQPSWFNASDYVA